ncbi:MAG: outer membrane beta-barrel protein [Lacibacter sp.]|jgi:hypothetical protein
MKRMLSTCLGLALCVSTLAQTDTTGKPHSDTLKVGNMIIIRKSDGTNKPEAEKEKKEREYDVKITTQKSNKNRNVTTNYWVFDLGFANVVDRTNYNAPGVSGPNGYFPGGNANLMDLRNGKSVNVNIWVFLQERNLIQHVVNLKYGLGLELNNYRYQSNIRHRFEPRDFIERDPDVTSFRKNKLAADYVTLPVMLNFNFAPRKKHSYGFSAGLSAGYLYSARQKMRSAERGKEKVKNDFNLQPWKLAAIGELKMGVFCLYGSYALNTMYRSGLDQTPYAIGIRFLALD